MPVGTAKPQQRQQPGAQGQRPRMRPLPFIACAHEHTEPGPVITRTYEEKSASEAYEFDIPSYGYYRSLFLQIEASGTEWEANTKLAKDGPWNVVEQITMLDTNGAPIFGPLTGYNAGLICPLLDGFTFKQDPREDPSYVAGSGTSKNFVFKLRVPTEIAHHSGVGSLGNQNASAPYRIRITLNASSRIWTTEKLKKYPTVKVTPVLEAWTLPNKQDAKGRPQSQLPPSYGTVMFHSERVVGSVPSGQYQVPVLRVGGLIRWIAFVGRETNSEGERSDAVFPTQPILFWDGRQLTNEPRAYRASRTNETINSTATDGRPTGVFAYTFNRTALDRCGDERPYLYLPTTEATRLELEGNFETGGVVNVITCEVAPAEVNPAQRYVESNATAFHPMGGTPNPYQV